MAQIVFQGFSIPFHALSLAGCLTLKDIPVSSLNPPPLSGNSMLDRWMSWLWEYIRQITGLPVQTGNSGKVLTTNGVTASWVVPASADVQTFTAAQALGGHRVVMRTSAGVDYADASISSNFGKAIGVTLSAAGAGSAISVQLGGDIEEPSWNWTLGTPVYLSANGLMTQTPPAYPSFSLVVGFPVTATRLFIALREPIILGA